MEELRKVQRDYGAAFANVLRLAKQRGLDCPTVERLLHAPTLDGQAVPIDVDLQAALQRAALAFRQVIGAVHNGDVKESSCQTNSGGTVSGDQKYATGIADDDVVGFTLANDTVVGQVEMSAASACKEG